MSTQITNKQVKVISNVNFNNNEIKNAKIDYNKNQITNLPEGGLVDDVLVNGISVVTNKVANISVPTQTSELENNSGYITNVVDNLVNYPTTSVMETALDSKQDIIKDSYDIDNFGDTLIYSGQALNTAETTRYGKEWEANVYYGLGQIIVSGIYFYRCIDEHTSAETFEEDIAYWEKVYSVYSYLHTTDSLVFRNGKLLTINEEYTLDTFSGEIVFLNELEPLTINDKIFLIKGAGPLLTYKLDGNIQFYSEYPLPKTSCLFKNGLFLIREQDYTISEDSKTINFRIHIDPDDTLIVFDPKVINIRVSANTRLYELLWRIFDEPNNRKQYFKGNIVTVLNSSSSYDVYICIKDHTTLNTFQQELDNGYWEKQDIIPEAYSRFGGPKHNIIFANGKLLIEGFDYVSGYGNPDIVVVFRAGTNVQNKQVGVITQEEFSIYDMISDKQNKIVIESNELELENNVLKTNLSNYNYKVYDLIDVSDNPLQAKNIIATQNSLIFKNGQLLRYNADYTVNTTVIFDNNLNINIPVSTINFITNLNHDNIKIINGLQSMNFTDIGDNTIDIGTKVNNNIIILKNGVLVSGQDVWEIDDQNPNIIHFNINIEENDLITVILNYNSKTEYIIQEQITNLNTLYTTLGNDSLIWKNNILLTNGNDYHINGGTIEFINPLEQNDFIQVYKINKDSIYNALGNKQDKLPELESGKVLSNNGNKLEWISLLEQNDFFEQADIIEQNNITGSIDIDVDEYLTQITDDTKTETYFYDGNNWRNINDEIVNLSDIGIDMSSTTYSQNSNFTVYSVCLRNKTEFTIPEYISFKSSVFLNGILQLKKNYNLENNTIIFNDYTLKKTDSISIL